MVEKVAILDLVGIIIRGNSSIDRCSSLIVTSIIGAFESVRF